MSISGNEAKISLRVYPNASRNEVVGFTEGVLRVRVSAPPSRGKANRELIAFLSRFLGVGKGSVNIIKGQHPTRDKIVAIDGLNREEVMKRLLPKFFSSGGATG